jgi:hypothetical protein
VNDTSRELGSAFGIAILGSVLNQTYRDNMAEAVHGLPPEVAAAAQDSIAVTQSSGIERLGQTGQHLVESAQTAFVDGSGSALLLAAGVVAIAAVVVAFLAPPSRRSESAVEPDAVASTAEAAGSADAKLATASRSQDGPGAGRVEATMTAARQRTGGSR